MWVYVCTCAQNVCINDENVGNYTYILMYDSYIVTTMCQNVSINHENVGNYTYIDV